MTPKTLAEVLDVSRLEQTAQVFVKAIADRPDLPVRLANMSLFLKEKSPKADARALARAAQALAPRDYRVRVLTDWLNRREAPLAEETQRVVLTTHTKGLAESVMRWLKLDFGEGLFFENRPPEISSWDPQLHILPQPRYLEAGQTLAIKVHHNRNRLFIWPVEEGATPPFPMSADRP